MLPRTLLAVFTGSLALGGLIGSVAVATKHEIVMAIIGGLFVMETLSVIVVAAPLSIVIGLAVGTLAWRSEDAGFWVYRFFSVVLATLTVWQALRLAERVGGRCTALGAGLLVAGEGERISENNAA